MVLDEQTGATMDFKKLDAPNPSAIHYATSTRNEIWTTQLKENGTVLILDAHDLRIIDSISVGRFPTNIWYAVTQNANQNEGRYLCVMNSGSDNITVIDPNTRQIVKTITLGESKGWSETKQNYAWTDMLMVNPKSKTVDIIDVVTLAVRSSLQLDFVPNYATYGHGIEPEIWVSDKDKGSVVIFNRITGEKTMDVATGVAPKDILVDLGIGYVINQGSNTVSIFNDYNNNAFVKTVNVGAKPSSIISTVLR